VAAWRGNAVSSAATAALSRQYRRVFRFISRASSQVLEVYHHFSGRQKDFRRSSKVCLTGKLLLTYSGRMVATADREQEVFEAISHPARRRILDLLLEADRSVNAIAGHFVMTRPAVSQHLRVLLDAGLVTEQRHGRERRYRSFPGRLGPVREWMAQYEQFWDERLQRLQKHLAKKGDG
jgi:DNA-binding transcriptional ArsR family regulator